MLTRSKFYLEWIRRALSGPLGWAQGIQILLTFVFGGLSQSKPDLVGELTPLLWIVPLTVFVATSLIVWTIAPYAMYRDLERSYETLLSEVHVKHAQLDQLIVRCRQLQSAADESDAQAFLTDGSKCLADNKGDSYALELDDKMEQLMRPEIYASGRAEMARKECIADVVEYLSQFREG